MMQHRERGEVPGPYVKLPLSSGLRRLVLDLVSTVFSLHGRDEGLGVAISKASSGTDEESYWGWLCASTSALGRFSGSS
jgi:pre-rRNA-processing protein IPI1